MFMTPIWYFFLIHSILVIASFVYLSHKEFFGHDAEKTFGRIISWFILVSFVVGICILGNFYQSRI